MTRKGKHNFRFAVVGGWFLALAVLASLGQAAQPNPVPGTEAPAQAEAASESAQSAEVVIEGHPVLSVPGPLGSLNAQERAEQIEQRIVRTAKDRTVNPEGVQVLEHQGWSEVVAGKQMIVALTDEDSAALNRPRAEIAQEYAGAVREAMIRYRGEHSWKFLLESLLYFILATAVFLLSVRVVGWLAAAAGYVLTRWTERGKLASVGRISTMLRSFFRAFGNVLRWIVLLALFDIYLSYALGLFPFTRPVSTGITSWLLSQLSGLGKSTVDYVPNLILVLAVCGITYGVVHLNDVFFGEVEAGRIRLRGFYPDWAQPTSRLVRLFIMVLAAVVVFPYLPGAKSPAFQGISIFLGVLLSLGSSSAVANAVAGTILTYMRSFLPGDWVKFGEVTGLVVEKSLLVTRIRTQRNEIVTIPNGTVLGAAVVNYSSEAHDRGVIFHTTVSIGYDAPWRQVHELLIAAAQATNNIMKEPAPFVLQTALNDFYVVYDLNAYTETPIEMPFIYSELHQNIQDRFNDAGVEICSPHFSALRDGNAIAIPKEYVPPDYKPRSFRVEKKAE
jgi:small-conductance mechanosensitive channel